MALDADVIGKFKCRPGGSAVYILFSALFRVLGSDIVGVCSPRNLEVGRLAESVHLHLETYCMAKRNSYSTSVLSWLEHILDCSLSLPS